MISYKDVTFCQWWLLCKDKGCERPKMTWEVKKEAYLLGVPVAQFAGKPECFRALWEVGCDT